MSMAPERPHSIADILDVAGKELKEEEDALLKTKELVLKEIGVLKAEEVTIQRLLEAHSRPPNYASSEQVTATKAATVTTTLDPVSATLPKINLDVHNSSSKQGCGDEYDDEDFDSD